MTWNKLERWDFDVDSYVYPVADRERIGLDVYVDSYVLHWNSRLTAASFMRLAQRFNPSPITPSAMYAQSKGKNLETSLGVVADLHSELGDDLFSKDVAFLRLDLAEIILTWRLERGEDPPTSVFAYSAEVADITFATLLAETTAASTIADLAPQVLADASRFLGRMERGVLPRSAIEGGTATA